MESLGSEEDADNGMKPNEDDEKDSIKTITAETSGMTIHTDGRVTFEKYSDESPSSGSQGVSGAEEVTSQGTEPDSGIIRRFTPPDSPDPSRASTPKTKPAEDNALDAFVESGGTIDGDNSIDITLLNTTDVTMTPREIGTLLAKRDRETMSPGLLQEEMQRLEVMAAEGEANIELQATKLV
jgi:hypothetical protein